MALKLQTIICSTRPGRVGPKVADWFHAFARRHDRFDCELVDLADFNLPLFDEPEHPAKQQYQHDHTKAWSKSVSRADAYVFVIPEYNYSPPPSFVNAVDFVYREWNYKPCGFVSYGGVSGGLRSVQAARLHVTTLKMMPLMEGVMIQMPWDRLNDDGSLKSDKLIENSAGTLLDELHKWAVAMQGMRS